MKNENKKIARLIKQIQRGNQSAFEEFYKLTSPKAYFIALKITQNEHDAEDILQESYMKALEKIAEIDPSQNITSWFLKIVANKSKDLLRSRNRFVFEGEEETVFEDIPEDKTEFCPEENLEMEELRLEVMAAIDELTDEKRACIMMMYFGDMSVKEIAESIEVPESTVKNRLYTARKDLKTRFEKNGSVLYGAALGGLLVWALNKTSLTASAAFLATAASAQIAAGAGAAASTAAAGSATAATTAAGTGGAIAAKVAAVSIAQKVAVGIAATAIVGGSTAGVVTVVKNANEEPTTAAYTEEVTTSVALSKEYAFNWFTFPEFTRESTTRRQPERTSRAPKTTKPSTTARVTTAKPTTTQKATTTQAETTTERETTTQPTTETTTVPTTQTTTEPTTQAKATVSISIIDLDGSVIDTVNLEVEQGTVLSREYIVTAVQANGYEPMAGVYGDIGAVAQGGNTYSFEAEL